MISEHIAKDVILDEMTNAVTTKKDSVTGTDLSFSKGGFAKFTFSNEDWFGWTGVGGTWFIYNPNHDCVVTYTTGGFMRPGYVTVDPRFAVYINLISQELSISNQA